ncbi:hypothetical protein C1645_827802 [Glomus cerebriforme]|uniref:Uncharacterized protein n=1 Tax=Glomus cerebriforme TaxID=658196 RepID=A0A397SMK0_9GLOM|nr:hypothetical protein C1645_827802 [Glomus cerebriforme]
MAVVHEKILNHVKYGCKVDSPNVVILESGGVPSSDEDNWPQLRPILGQWHTSKDMCSVLIVLFSSYDIFNLANFLGVKFLEKLESVVDYRSTVRVLELIWTSVALAILGNYDLQKNALAAFGGLFASAAKTRYASSVCHFIASTGNHAINQRYDTMWNLVNILLQEFDKTNESFLNNDMWKNVYRTQLTVEGVTRLKNCFPDGVIRMRAIYYEDVLKTRSIQPGRSKLGVPKLKILTFQKELKEAAKNKKTTERTQTLDSQLQSNAEGSTNIKKKAF